MNRRPLGWVVHVLEDIENTLNQQKREDIASDIRGLLSKHHGTLLEVSEDDFYLRATHNCKTIGQC